MTIDESQLDRALTFAQALEERARLDPGGELIRRTGEAPWSADECWRTTTVRAHELGAEVGRGDAVVTALDTGPVAVTVSAAVSALGAVEVPLSPDICVDWAAHLLHLTRPHAVVSTYERLAVQPWLESWARQHRVVILVVDESAVEGPAVALTPATMSPTDPALVMTTSGTTGRVKAALLPVGAPVAQARRVAAAMAYGPGDVALNFFQWHHINARNACFLPTLLSGARMVVAPRFSASGFLDLVRDEDVTVFNFMGAVCGMVLAQPTTERDQDHALRAAYGGPAPAWMVERFHRRFGVVLRQAYACTELGDVAVTTVSALLPGSCGRPVDDYDVKIIDADGTEVEDGAVGEVLVRPRRDGLAFLEYVGDAHATAEAWADDWFRTRDRGRLHDGWLFVDGRVSDVIRRRGENIDPELVEGALMTHDDVLEVAAVAVPSPFTEDDILVVVRLVEGSTTSPQTLWTHSLTHLPRHAVPRYFSVEDDIPHNGNHKVDRVRLRKRGLPATFWDAGDPPALEDR